MVPRERDVSPREWDEDDVARGRWRRQTLDDLAQKLARLRAGRVSRAGSQTPSGYCASGLPALDAALGGGFALGGTYELLAPALGAATRSLALLAAARAAGSHRRLVYIDPQADLYPPGVAQLGVPLARLLVIRASGVDAYWACEQTLRCPAVAAVILAAPSSVDAQISRRLQLAAEAGGGLGLLLCAQPGGHSFATGRLQLDPLVGETESRRLLVTVRKLRERRPPPPFVLELPDAAGALSVHAVLRDRSSPQQRPAARVG